MKGDTRHVQNAEAIDENFRKGEEPMEDGKESFIESQGQIEETGGKRQICLIPDGKFKEYEKRMLCDSGCPYTLPMHFISDNGKDTVYYDFTGYLRLKDYMMSKRPSDCRGRNNGEGVCETLNLLIEILRCIKGMEQYLLFSDRYSLHPDVVFVHPDNLQTAIAFYPVDEQENTLQERIIGLIDCIREWGCSEETMKYFNQLKETVALKNPGLDGLIGIIGALCREAGYIYWNADALREAINSSVSDHTNSRKEENEAGKVIVNQMIMRKSVAAQVVIAVVLIAVYLSGFFDNISFIGFTIIAAGADIWILRKLRSRAKAVF